MKMLLSLGEARSFMECSQRVFRKLVANGDIKRVRVKGLDRNYYGSENLRQVRDALTRGGGTPKGNA